MDEITTQTIDAIQKLAKPHNKLENHFDAVRARTRGTIIAAHRDMNPSQGWNEADDRMLDMVTAWLDNLKGR